MDLFKRVGILSNPNDVIKITLAKGNKMEDCDYSKGQKSVFRFSAFQVFPICLRC